MNYFDSSVALRARGICNARASANRHHALLRGPFAVPRDDDAMALLGEIHASFETFKATNESRYNTLRDEMDRQAKSNAAHRVGGGDNGENGTIPVSVRSSMVNFLRAGINNAPQASMTTDSNPDGGYTVPVEIDKVIASQLLSVSPMRQLASVVTVNSGDYHKLVNKRGTASGWVGETESRPETDTPLLADIEPPIGEIYANPSLTQRVLDDSSFNLNDFITENIIDEFSQQEGVAFTTGNGTKKPIGFLSYPTAVEADVTRSFGTLQYVASGSGAGFATTNPGDNLVDLMTSLQPAYRAGDGVGWQMNSTTLGVVRKMKDGQGNYLWQQSQQAGQPSLILGYPVYENQNMQDLGVNAYPVAFGNWKRGYIIVDRIGVRALRDPYTKKGWVNFYVTKRVGGAVTDSNAIKLLKCA